MKNMVTQLKYLVNNINNKKNPLTASKDDVSKIESCQKIVESLNKLSILAAIGGLFASKGQEGIREYKKVLTNLKSLIKRIQSDGLDINQEDLKKIDNIEKLVEKLTIVSMLGSVMGITAPLSILGFKSMQLSAVAVGKMIDTLNGIEINDDFFNRLKNIGIVLDKSFAIPSNTPLPSEICFAFSCKFLKPITLCAGTSYPLNFYDFSQTCIPSISFGFDFSFKESISPFIGI